HDAKRKGPVPIGFWKNASSFLPAPGGSMPSMVRCAGSAPNGRLEVPPPAWSRSFSTYSGSWYTKDLMSLVFSFPRRRVNTTLSALNGVPSWKVTPFRSVKRQLVLLTARQDSAGGGTNFESLVTSTSG